MKLLNKFERKFPRFGIQGLMLYIVIAMGFVYFLDFAQSTKSFASLLVFDRNLIFSGEIWRVITFVFLPPTTSLIFVVFSLYFYYLIGSALESYWGTVAFNIFYLIGVLGNIVAGLLTGTAYNFYLNMSLFFAFAILYPDFQILVFFFLPIKIKYLAFINLLMFIASLVSSIVFKNYSEAVSIIISMLNIIIFFGGDFINKIKNNLNYRDSRKRFRNQSRF
jgi:hypothetical protein